MIEVIHTIQIPVSQLVPNNGQIDGIPKNPRFIRNERFEKLVKSIQDNPEFLGARELIVHKQGDKYIVLCGNMRFRAAKDLRFDSLPCKVIPEYFSLEQIKAIIIKDNISFGSDDMDALANEWEVSDLADWGMEFNNFVDTLTNNEDYEGLDQLSKLDKFMNAEVKRMFLVYDNETFEKVIKWFESKQTKYNLDDNSKVILKLMENENI
jgi:hypothetical protein